VLGVVLLLAALAVVLLASLAIGSRQVPIDIVIDTVRQTVRRIDVVTNDALIVRDMRLPRTAMGLVAGMALGAAGALMQAITRNPLADPGLLGVNAGAAFAAVVGVSAFGLGRTSGLVWFALVGAAIASVVVYTLGSVGRGGATPVRLTLAGMALSALLVAVTSGIILRDQEALQQYRFWVVGSLPGRDIGMVVQVLPFVAVGLVLAIGVAYLLNALALGDDTARTLGTNIAAAKSITALAVTLLCGAATAACGPIVFVGLVVPHVVRMWFGPDERWVVPASMLAGPVLLLGSDIVGRVIASPSEVQVGIMTAALGGPMFVALVRRTRVAQL
jgi:iron complex transport system permease protein